MNTFTAKHTWERISKQIIILGEEIDETLYKKLSSNEQCIRAIEAIQKEHPKIEFKSYVCYHWACELCGSFEVTAPNYVSPVGSDSESATILYEIVESLI